MKSSIIHVEKPEDSLVYDKFLEMGLSAQKLVNCQLNCYEAGEYILHEGDPLHFLFVIISGTVKVCVDGKNGKNLTFCNYISSGILGDVGFMLNQYVSTTTVIATTDFSCIAIPLIPNVGILKESPGFLNYVGRELAMKLVWRGNAHVASALFSSEERLCAYILQSQRNGIFHEHLTETAAAIGISYRHVFRIINKLCDQGIMEKTEDGFQILDWEKLREKGCIDGESGVEPLDVF